MKSLLLGLTFAFLLIISSWLEGGYGRMVLPLFSFCAIPYAIICALNILKGSGVRSQEWKLWHPWALLILVLFCSILNPSHEATSFPQKIIDDEGKESFKMVDGYDDIEHYRILPSAFRPDISQTQTFYHIAIFVYAFSLWFALNKRKSVLCLLALIFLNGFVLALVGIYFKLNSNGLLLGLLDPVNDRFFSSFRYNNHWAAHAVLSFCSGVALYFEFNKGKYKKIALILLLLSIAVILFAVSIAMTRSAIILLFLLLLFLSYQLLKKQLFSARGYRAYVYILLFISISFSTFYFVAHKVNESRGGDTKALIEGIRNAELPLRVFMHRDAAKLIVKKPLWGWGIGSYHSVFPVTAGAEFRMDRYQRETKHYGKLIWPHYAHNDWLQYGAEIGLIGFLLLVLTPYRIIRFARNYGYANNVSLWCYLGCVLVLIMALWDFPLGNPAVLIQLVALFILGSKLRTIEC